MDAPDGAVVASGAFVVLMSALFTQTPAGDLRGVLMADCGTEDEKPTVFASELNS